ncbi:MAG TPA: dienelactone hydrolase family protein [Burkholderiales bacterium]|nr:dienelactone hydrolase family protein [Burkholderiales bacterium]
MNDRVVPAGRIATFVSCFLVMLSMASYARMGTQISPAAIGWMPVAAPAELNAPGAQWIKVEARAGHKMLAAVFRPQGAGPFPVVVVLHGASGLQPDHLALAEEVARAGFVVVAGCWQLIASPPAAAPNPVCSEAPPQAAWQADPAANSGKELIAAARTLPGVRSDRVGLYGLSRGGNAALWAASTGASVQAVVVDAPAHLPLRVDPPPPSTQSAVAGLAAPTLLLHGTADRVVPVDQSREYERAARALGKPIRAVYIDGMGHMVTFTPPAREAEALAEVRRKTQPEARRQAIEFLREHLK